MNEESNCVSSVFHRLKEVCDPLMTDLSSENVNALFGVMKSIPDEVLPLFSEYVLFPVQFHLLKHHSGTTITDNVLLQLVQCLKFIFGKSVINTWEKFVNLHGLLLRLVVDEEELSKRASEELKYEVISCVRSSYESLYCRGDLLEKLYNCETKLNIHSEAVYVCTQIARNEKFIKLRVEAMKCLLTIMCVHGEEYCLKIAVRNEVENLVRWHIAEIVASMFPGIISSCHYILTFHATLHRDICVYGVRLLCRCVTVVFEDFESLKDSGVESQLAGIMLKCKSDSNNETDFKRIRSKDWYYKATEKLSTFLSCLVPICHHRHQKVRGELVKGVGIILKKCFKKLDPMRTIMLHILVILSLDDTNEVGEESRHILKTLLDENAPTCKKVLENLEESFLRTVTSVGSALNCADETTLMSQLTLLNGLLRILNLGQIFKSVCLDDLTQVLVNCVRFDPAAINTFNELRIQDMDTKTCEITSQISWRNAKYLNSVTEPILKKAFKTISQKVNLEFFACHLLDILESNPSDRKEIIYLINEIILQVELQNDEKRVEIGRMILNVYLDPMLWTIATSEDDHKNLESSSLVAIKHNLFQVCTLIEGIGNMAFCLKDEFKPFLIHCLYLLIEGCGCTNKFLSSIGLTSLRKITQACGYNDITELITENIDFIMHSAVLKLRHLEPNTKVFDVFFFIIAYSRERSLPVLSDVIKYLLASDDILQVRYTSEFLRVFAIFIRKLRCWFVPLAFNECVINESDEMFTDVLFTLNEVHAQRSLKNTWHVFSKESKCSDLESAFKKTEYDMCNDDDFTAVDDEIQNGPLPANNSLPASQYEKKESPLHVKIICIIAKKILHILPHQNISDKILIVEILIDSLSILNEFRDELLPVVHEIWTPLVNRFQYDKSDFLLMRRCFELLCVMALTAKDFLRSRTLKLVQPAINQFLVDSTKDSLLKDYKSVYRMSQRYKFQYTLLRQLGLIVVQMEFQENEVNALLVAATPYLSSKQPLPLQVACVRLFETLESKYHNFVRIYLLSMYMERRILYPSKISKFRLIRLKEPDRSVTSEYQKNISNLLQDKITLCWSLNLDA